MNTIAIHEAAHVIAFLSYDVKTSATASGDRGLTQPEPHYLTKEQQLIVYCAGVCGEVMYGERKVSPHVGAYGDALLICALLGVDKIQAHGYATALALIAEGKTARLLPPTAHVEMLRTAIATAKEVLSKHQRILRQIAAQLEKHGATR